MSLRGAARHRVDMHITQLRNATILVQVETPVGPASIVVDPMLAEPGTIPALRRLTRRRRRNPLVPLPPQATAALTGATHALITHCQRGHFDHLDRAGTRWLRETQLPVVCSPHDAAYLTQRGLRVEPLVDDALLGGRVTRVRCRHGRGLIGRLMEHGSGYVIELPGEPTLYLAGDTVLTDEVRAVITERQPDVVVLPAGGARFDVGAHIIMDEDEVLEAASLSRGTVIANHLEALDHCPTTRASLRAKAHDRGLAARLRVPDDGETLRFAADGRLVA